jgi:Putative threonine efflux protein
LPESLSQNPFSGVFSEAWQQDWQNIFIGAQKGWSYMILHAKFQIMFDSYQLYLFCITSVLLALTPGPDILTVVARGISQGRKSALVAAAGFFSRMPESYHDPGAGHGRLVKSFAHSFQRD